MHILHTKKEEEKGENKQNSFYITYDYPWWIRCTPQLCCGRTNINQCVKVMHILYIYLSKRKQLWLQILGELQSTVALLSLSGSMYRKYNAHCTLKWSKLSRYLGISSVTVSSSSEHVFFWPYCEGSIGFIKSTFSTEADQPAPEMLSILVLGKKYLKVDKKALPE